jgi:hypothetical protein
VSSSSQCEQHGGIGRFTANGGTVPNAPPLPASYVPRLACRNRADLAPDSAKYGDRMTLRWGSSLGVKAAQHKRGTTEEAEDWRTGRHDDNVISRL